MGAFGKAKGYLKYSPKKIGLRKSEKWWLVLQASLEFDETFDYYRHLGYLGVHKTQKWNKPAWGYHVSIIRNEVPTRPEFWELYAGKEYEFEYEMRGDTDGIYYWLDVKCEPLLDLREELGLVREVMFGLHITIGNLKGV